MTEIRSGDMCVARTKSRSDFILAVFPPGVHSARKTGQWPVFSENGPAGPGKREGDRKHRWGVP